MKNNLKIDCSLNIIGIKSIEISDLQGRLVKTAQNKIHSATLKTSVNDLVAGTYVVKIDTGKGIFVKKLIKK
ncbi:T9SS type A sorting domain-containing protein [uncultured Chryseobacterium sp.]|uniref:T9SS type A sorting domain-containing protein n=1 Tax=uncultured Chryseobacterium sp. TaxID=259322 RepID=UPI0025F7CDFA|nr:T9SS type A sorting domain-containing protein [uncultured Chryseobacterium sp.]